MEFTGERLVLGQVDVELEIEHLNRYYFAKQFVQEKAVLDAACGTGYGTAILAQKASDVTGIDISKEAIEYARKTYSDENIRFVEGSVTELPFDRNSFDTVISFETIEHIGEAEQKAFLKEIKRVLKENGVLVISSPNRSVYNQRGENHFHVKELDYEEFDILLKSKFRFVKFFSQKFEICNTILSDQDSVSYINRGEMYENAEYLIAVCSDVELPEINTNVIMRNDKKLESLMSWAIENHHSNEELGNRLGVLNAEVDEKNRHIQQLLENEKCLYHEVARCKVEAEKQKRELETLTVELSNKQGHIEQLLVADRELTNIKNSRAWRMMGIMWKVSGAVFPIGSKRRLLAKMGAKFAKHPIRFLKKVNPKRVKKFCYYLRREGVSGVSRRLDNCVRGTDVDPIRLEVTERMKTLSCIEEYKNIIVPFCEKPKVSIVIPVYNQFGYTYNCIDSIVRNSGNITYEIIIANDCSTDLTMQIEKVVQGITVITNEVNLRFLKNCNHAAKYAKGEYILFLNNDTQVQENWLEPLVELIERDEKIGMVGSKLVYPDGRLQEAGGILWKDGSAWNYGHLSDPTDPEYNYVKEADYISGAAIMIRKTLWEEIGGFDERFVPAYYEDTDLAFEVRKHGYKVMYQPLSVVVHFEGVSNGTDTSSGQKQYQVVNAQKFYDKWKDILETEHMPNAENVFKAKDKSLFKKHILVVDHYIPHYDQDAGGKCTWMYMELFVSLGMKVTFIGDNFFKHEPYATKLTQMGVEVLYGSYYYNNWKNWLKENGEHFDYAYLNRPHISEKYIDILKKYSACKIIYFGHDLHYLREMRQYEIEKNPELLKSSQDWKKKEFALFDKADVIYVVGSYEQEILKKEFPNKAVHNIPVYMYNELKQNINTDFSSRKDIIFVGGFGHTPNIDAVLWFEKNIFPKILEKNPDIKWYIVGSKPTEEIKNLANENIIVTGFVEDEELERLYAECRMAVVPLRIGAGVKGKVVEAVYNRIPLITTPIGAEGLSLAENAFVVTECDEKMADVIHELYSDYDKLAEMSENCKAFILNHFTSKVAASVVSQDIDYTEKIR